MSRISFLFKTPIPKESLRLLGIMYAAKTAALKQNPQTQRILIRMTAHEETRDTQTGKIMKDLWHYTLDIKDKKMIEDGTHLTLHGYVGNTNPNPDKPTEFRNMWFVDKAVPKQRPDGTTAKVEPDEWTEKRTGKKINNWAGAKEIAEPEELDNVRLGETFITLIEDFEERLKLNPTERQKKEHDAMLEEEEAREAAAEELKQK